MYFKYVAIISYIGKCAFDYWVRVEQPEIRPYFNVPEDLINEFVDSSVEMESDYKPITESRCLQVEPRWMYDNQELLGDLRLKDILLTGTHDAAAFK